MKKFLFIFCIFFTTTLFAQVSPIFSYKEKRTCKGTYLYWYKDSLHLSRTLVRGKKTLSIFRSIARSMDDSQDSVYYLYAMTSFNQTYGCPKLRWLPDMCPVLHILSGADRSMFIFHENAMYLDTLTLDRSDVYEIWGSRFGGLWFTELMHARQRQLYGDKFVAKELFEAGWSLVRAGFSPKKYREKYDSEEYSRPGSIEYEAHEEFEPAAYKEFVTLFYYHKYKK